MRPGFAHFAATARRVTSERALTLLVALTAAASLHHAACGGPRGAASPDPRCDAVDRADVRVGCPCPAGLEPLGGGCVTQAARAPACGPRSDPADLACAPVRCPSGEALEPDRGACVTPTELAALPGVTWLGLRAGERLDCPDGGTLELARGRVACRAQDACRFHTIWNGVACAKPTPCPAGAYREITRDEQRDAGDVRDAGDAGDVRDAGDASDGGPRRVDSPPRLGPPREAATCTSLLAGRAVDLGVWLRGVVEPALCPLLPLGPAETYVVEASAVGNELAALSIAVEPAPTSPAELAPTTTSVDTLRRATEALAEGLRSLRLETTATRATHTVTCPERPSPSPRIEPKELDAGW